VWTGHNGSRFDSSFVTTQERTLRLTTLCQDIQKRDYFAASQKQNLLVMTRVAKKWAKIEK
jgi:hypothetical protein